MQNPRLTIIVPCYNEEAVLPKSAHILDGILTDLIQHKQVNAASKLLFVDDGSQDKTWKLIKSLEKQYSTVTVLSLVVILVIKTR